MFKIGDIVILNKNGKTINRELLHNNVDEKFIIKSFIVFPNITPSIVNLELYNTKDKYLYTDLFNTEQITFMIHINDIINITRQLKIKKLMKLW